MTSEILPITNHQTPNAHSSSLSSSSALTMLLKYDDEENPYTSLLHSSLKNNNSMSIKPLLSRSSSFNSSINNIDSIGAVPSFYQKTRRRVASEDSLAYVSNSSSRGSSFGRDVRHVASETFLLTRLGLKMLTYLGYELSILDSVYFYL